MSDIYMNVVCKLKKTIVSMSHTLKMTQINDLPAVWRWVQCNVGQFLLNSAKANEIQQGGDHLEFEQKSCQRTD